jgi:hypothetical protein
MMSIWTIDDNNPVLRKPAASVASAGRAPSGTARLAAEDGAVAEKEVALLRARLDTALRLLEVERSRNKALADQDHLM